MKATVGDRIVIASNHVDGPVRDCVVVELRHPDGTPPYVVEWSDNGQTGMMFPGPDAHVLHTADQDRPAAPVHSGQLVKKWHVEIDVFEAGDNTTAHAVLRTGAPAPLGAQGEAHRNPHDSQAPAIGDEVAVARALRHLAEGLLEAASSDIAAAEGHPVRLRG
jgi:Domain of unknown function (DUF1876)/Domain of unknown function (DUF1918)